MAAKKVKTRFAPSPTGYLHVGGARTALFNYLYARSQGGDFVLRIEDTDRERSTEESYQLMLESIEWLGLDWDEGPGKDKGNGPYRQSERLGIYKEYTEKLVSEKKAYPCFCTGEELEAKKKQREAMGLPPVYDGKCRNLSDDEIAEKKEQGLAYTIRFKTPAEEIAVNDIVQGTVRFDTSLIGDFIIVKSDGYPSYNYAVVVDDHLMQISHVIRGVGHLSNTPRQIMIFRALGFEEPAWAHVSEIVGSDHKKLSKRHGATAITAFRDLGYQAKAFRNYMALLGWSPADGHEFMQPEKLNSVFDIARCSKSPSMFDVFDLKKTGDVNLSGLDAAELENYLFEKSKLNWLSNQHIRDTADDTYISEILPFVEESGQVPAEELKSDNPKLRELLLALRVYLDYYRQIGQYIGDFFSDYSTAMLDAAAEEWMKNNFFVKVAETFLQLISDKNEWTEEAINSTVKETGKQAGEKGKNLFMSVRVATTGRTKGLELPVYLKLLGRERVIDRLEKNIKMARG